MSLAASVAFLFGHIRHDHKHVFTASPSCDTLRKVSQRLCSAALESLKEGLLNESGGRDACLG